MAICHICREEGLLTKIPTGRARPIEKWKPTLTAVTTVINSL